MLLASPMEFVLLFLPFMRAPGAFLATIAWMLRLASIGLNGFSSTGQCFS